MPLSLLHSPKDFKNFNHNNKHAGIWLTSVQIAELPKMQIDSYNILVNQTWTKRDSLWEFSLLDNQDLELLFP